jgi:hypothetical protein
MMVLLTLALSVRHFLANYVHSPSSFSLKSTYSWVLWIMFLADFLLLFSLSSSCFLFFDLAPNFPPPLSSSLDEVSTILKDDGRITLNQLVTISLWLVEKSMRGQLIGLGAILQVQLETGAYRPEYFCWEEVFQLGPPFEVDIMSFNLLDK